MRPDWREVPKDNYRGQWASMYVTLNPKGEIVMSRYTYEHMGGPKTFQVLFDTVNNRIGLKPAAESTRNAFRAGRRGRHGGRRLCVYRMMSEFKITLPDTLRFTNVETDEDGVLILDLRTAKISPHAAAWKRKRAGDTEL